MSLSHSRHTGAIRSEIAIGSRFEQSLDKTRPLLLVTPEALAKKSFDLVYEYTDTKEKVRVPNIWYNQTAKMRIEHWEWEIKHRSESIQKLKAEIKTVEHSTDKALQKIARELKYSIEQQTESLSSCKQALADIKAGIRLV